MVGPTANRPRRELAKLARQIKAEHVKALCLDSITDPRTMQRIAAETGAVIGGTLFLPQATKRASRAFTAPFV
jgi:zinc/manganese transport system substrate-binding protein